MSTLKEMTEGNIEAIDSNIRMLQAILKSYPNSEIANYHIEQLSGITQEIRNQILVIETLTLGE